jgi:hypothetical protein
MKIYFSVRAVKILKVPTEVKILRSESAAATFDSGLVDKQQDAPGAVEDQSMN